MADEHDPYAALRYADYRRLLAGNLLASLATTMQAAAVEWEVFQRTQSKAALGYVGLVLFLPVLLLSLPAGQAADRYSRRGLLAIALGVGAIASCGLAVLSFVQGPVPLIYLCLLLGGVSRAFTSPCRWALVPMVVPLRHLTNAVTWNSSGWQVASVAGPALAGLLIGLTQQAAAAYLLAAGCALGFAGLLATIHPRVQVPAGEPRSLATFLAGVRFVWQSKLILATITLDLFAVLLGGATVLLPAFADTILHVGPIGFGWLRAAPSLGALLMAVVLAFRPPLQRAGPTLLWAVAGFGVATIIFGLSENFLLSFAMLALTGALDNISIVVRGTLVQVLTPEAMRGRVSAVNAVFIGSSNELGAFESGMTAQWFGLAASVVGGGIGTLLVVLAVMARWPEVLRLGPLHRAAEPATDGERGALAP